MAANALCCEAHTGGWVGFGQWSQNSMFYGMVGISRVLLSASVDPFTLGDASPVLFVKLSSGRVGFQRFCLFSRWYECGILACSWSLLGCRWGNDAP